MEEKFIMGNVATMSDQGAHNMRNEIRQPLTKEGWKAALQTLGSKQGECTVTRQIEYITEEVRKKMEALFPGLDWTKDEDVKKVTTHLARARLAEIRRALEEGTET